MAVIVIMAIDAQLFGATMAKHGDKFGMH